MFSGLLDKSPLVRTGNMPLQPTSSTQFKIHQGKRGHLQELFANFGSRVDSLYGKTIQKPAARYEPHNCLPWCHDSCLTHPNVGSSHLGRVTAPHSPIIELQPPMHFPPRITGERRGHSSRFALSRTTDHDISEDLYSSSFTHSKRRNES